MPEKFFYQRFAVNIDSYVYYRFDAIIRSTLRTYLSWLLTWLCRKTHPIYFNTHMRDLRAKNLVNNSRGCRSSRFINSTKYLRKPLSLILHNDTYVIWSFIIFCEYRYSHHLINHCNIYYHFVLLISSFLFFVNVSEVCRKLFYIQVKFFIVCFVFVFHTIYFHFFFLYFFTKASIVFEASL